MRIGEQRREVVAIVEIEVDLAEHPALLRLVPDVACRVRRIDPPVGPGEAAPGHVRDRPDLLAPERAGGDGVVAPVEQLRLSLPLGRRAAGVEVHQSREPLAVLGREPAGDDLDVLHQLRREELTEEAGDRLRQRHPVQLELDVAVIAPHVQLAERVEDEAGLGGQDVVHARAVAAGERQDVVALDLGGRAGVGGWLRRLALRGLHGHRFLKRGQGDVELQHVTGGDAHLAVIHPAVGRGEGHPVLAEGHLLELEMTGGIRGVYVQLRAPPEQFHLGTGDGMTRLVVHRSVDDPKVGGERGHAPPCRHQGGQDGASSTEGQAVGAARHAGSRCGV